MAHHNTSKSAYADLLKRLNRFPQGATSSRHLFDILKILFSEPEAEKVALLPLRPFTARKAAGIWDLKESEADVILQKLAARGILLDIMRDGRSVYTLPPPMAGFFEFSLMRIGGVVDERALSELYYKYINVEDDFIKSLVIGGPTQASRVFIHEPSLPENNIIEIYDYEKTSEVIKSARRISIGRCYCRHKMFHVGKACSAPTQNCITLNDAAESLSKHGITKIIDSSECMDVISEAYANNLVQIGENVQTGVHFICNCCSCCCEALLAVKRFAFLHPIHTTGFIATIDPEICSGCAKCINICPIQAITLVSSSAGDRKRAETDKNLCLGCGICIRSCPKAAIKMVPRKRKVITPVDTAQRFVLMAIERNKLQNLIFDSPDSGTHRFLAVILGAILRLPPVKRALANRQLQSIYLKRLMEIKLE